MEKKKCKQSAISCQLSRFLKRLNAERRTLNAVLSNENGIALPTVMALAAIGLAIMAGLIYMLTSGTQVSGMQKRYKTALEAGTGGADVTIQLIKLRGDATSTSTFTASLPSAAISTPGTCTGTNMAGTAFTGLAAKLNTPTTSWAGCDTSLSISPGTNTSYDMQFDLGSYRVYTKIVDTTEGNSAADEGLIKGGVVSSNSGEITVVSIPYLYTIEVGSENPANAAERAKLSVLYQY